MRLCTSDWPHQSPLVAHFKRPQATAKKVQRPLKINANQGRVMAKPLALRDN